MGMDAFVHSTLLDTAGAAGSVHRRAATGVHHAGAQPADALLC